MVKAATKIQKWRRGYFKTQSLIWMRPNRHLHHQVITVQTQQLRKFLAVAYHHSLPLTPHQDQATVGQRWAKWVRRFENLLISLREFDATVRRGLLLTYVGESTNDIFDILPDTGTTYQAAIDALTQHFTPRE